ncbi:predicted protein [Naegleria gruberi]|uniref:Predicted protein n=1 Tax=Naegleria gruberi TaxID=5762 RepID=D2V560_NAEGR|nr:uncharacterized protein NAEGRDRAFT_64024 [Naegleria gruberi]EFC48219.1 predicted protein [Naegleria gruberi]|eukprot:XP_002680963.1 predicted protein [Naegleria gruberi strain NEG-M]
MSIVDEQEVSERLELGDFKDRQCLTISEVAQMLSKKKEEVEQEQTDYINDVFDKSLTYARRFGGGLSVETTMAIKSALGRATVTLKDSQERRKLQPFQIAQLANLMPGDAEEAATLIPSLKAFDETEIGNLLKDLESLKGI